MGKYDDILNEQWPRSTLRPKMPLNQRAKIFLPFSALAGYDDALEETLENAVKKIEGEAGKMLL